MGVPWHPRHPQGRQAWSVPHGERQAIVLTFPDAAAQKVIIINYAQNDFLITQPYKHVKICIAAVPS